MQNKRGRLTAMHRVGSGLLQSSFDDERNELTWTCPGCGCTCVTAPGREAPTMEHEYFCEVLTLMESVNQGGLFGN